MGQFNSYWPFFFTFLLEFCYIDFSELAATMGKTTNMTWKCQSKGAYYCSL